MFLLRVAAVLLADELRALIHSNQAVFNTSMLGGEAFRSGACGVLPRPTRRLDSRTRGL
jgi:hypothetical protein